MNTLVETLPQRPLMLPENNILGSREALIHRYFPKTIHRYFPILKHCYSRLHKESIHIFLKHKGNASSFIIIHE